LASFEGVELANLAADTVQKVTTAAERGIRRIRGTRAPGLLVPTSLRLILAGPACRLLRPTTKSSASPSHMPGALSVLTIRLSLLTGEN
jgi:hypothetical protein